MGGGRHALAHEAELRIVVHEPVLAREYEAAAALCGFAGVWLVTKSKSRAQVEAEAGMKKG